MLVTNEPVPEINDEPDAPTNRPVPPAYTSGPLNVTRGPSTTTVPVQEEKSWSPLAAVYVVVFDEMPVVGPVKVTVCSLMAVVRPKCRS